MILFINQPIIVHGGHNFANLGTGSTQDPKFYDPRRKNVFQNSTKIVKFETQPLNKISL